MTNLDAVKTGVIIKIDSIMRAGYIIRDGDGEHLYFTFDDVVKDVGLGVPLENQRVQFIQNQDLSSNRLIATQVTVLAGKRLQKRS